MDRELADQEESRKPDRESGWFSRVLRTLLGLILAILLGLGLGLGLYLGIPAVYRELVEPVQQNSSRIAELEREFEPFQQSVREALDRENETLSELNGRLSEQRESLAQLEAEVASLGEAKEDQLNQIDDLQAELADLQSVEDQLADLEDRLDEAVDSLAEMRTPPSQELLNALQQTQAMTLMLRGRMWIQQRNFGLAEEDLLTAREILEFVQRDLEGERSIRMGDALALLDLALEDLESAPTTAVEELDAAWNLLLLPIEE